MFSIFRVVVHAFGVSLQICGCLYTGVNCFHFYRPLRTRKAIVSSVISVCLSVPIRGNRILLIFLEFLHNSLYINLCIFKYNKVNKHLASVAAYVRHTVAQFMIQVREVPCSEAERTKERRDRFKIHC